MPTIEPDVDEPSIPPALAVPSEEEDSLLDSLRRQYLQLVTPTDIDISSIPSSLLLSEPFQHRLYTEIFNSPSAAGPAKWPLPPVRYTTRVVKRLINKIEEEAFKEGYGCPEIDEELIDFYATLIANTPAYSTASAPSGPSTPPNSRSHVTYIITPPDLSPPSIAAATLPTNQPPPQTDSITLLESRSIISGSGHTGARTWEAAMALGELLLSSYYHDTLKHPFLSSTSTTANNNSIYSCHLKNKNVLELGAGTGFLSILAAKLGAGNVLATDGDWRVCDALKSNVRENMVEEVVKVGRLLWGSGGLVEEAEDEDDEGDGEGVVGVGVSAKERDNNNNNHNQKKQEKGYIIPDIILAADVTYDTSIIPSLVKELHFHLSAKRNPHAIVLLAATIRNEDTFSVFLRELEQHSLSFTSEIWKPVEPRMFYYPYPAQNGFSVVDSTAPIIRILRITCSPLVAIAAAGGAGAGGG